MSTVSSSTERERLPIIIVLRSEGALMQRSKAASDESALSAKPALLFLSHSGIDGEAARELRRSGAAAGFRVWLDVEGGLQAGTVGWQA